MTYYYLRELGIVPSILVLSVGHQARAPTIRPSCARMGTVFWARRYGFAGEGVAVQESLNFGNWHEQPFPNSDDAKISTLGRCVCAVAAKPEDLPRVRP